MFLVLVAAQNFNPSWDGLSGNRIVLFLAAENLKKTIPAFPAVGRVEQESCF